jgi:hypothetical protein
MNDQQKARRRKANKIVLSVFGGFILLIIIIVAASGGSKTKTVTQTPTNNITSQATTAQQPAKAAAAPPARQVTGTATTLGAGTFAGGKDVAPGLYDVTPGPGESGNFIVTGTDMYDEVLGTDSSDGGVPKVRATISNGDQIQISGLSSVTFTPVTAAYVTAHATTTLYAGTFTVGQDIGAGKYVATPGSGESGNFIVTGNDSYDEILGGDNSEGGVPSVTATLTDGDIVSISGLSQVTLTADN